LNVGGTVTDNTPKAIHIKWVRSGIGFTRHQKKVVRSLGLLRLNQVVERPDSPQIRGLVESVPHLVRIVSAPAKPAWMSVPEYTIFPPDVAAAPVARPAKAKPSEAEPESVAEAEAQGTKTAGAESKKADAHAEHAAKAHKPAKAASGKAKPAKAGEAKKTKGAAKSSKPVKKNKK
jgi:large subunit ribosomal protein L30